ncbi:iron-sulfur cluster assembly accessory protein [Gammaproteobacteria bacterium]|nr:iron-sulfur cluster assembly accessory protein [Gammaproteobacteria bacterium]
MTAIPAWQQAITPDMLTVTPSALEKMRELMQGADDHILGIRVYVSGGGCSGMQYGMTFADQSTERDHILVDGDLQFYIDPVAMSYLSKAEIDYQEDGLSATFVFNNVFQSVGGSGACGGCGSAV